jgi:hypothetical protein
LGGKQLIDEKDIQSFFGVPFEREGGQTSESGYILFYQARATAAPYTEAHYMQAAQLFKVQRVRYSLQFRSYMSGLKIKYRTRRLSVCCRMARTKQPMLG